MGILKFYLECVSRAFSGKYSLVEKWSAGLGMISLIVSKVIGLPEWITDSMVEELPMYFFITVFLCTVLVGFVVAPYSIYKEEREVAFQLRKLREPKLKVFTTSTEGVVDKSGKTSTMTDGSRQQRIAPTTYNAVSLVVKNIGETRIDRCTAQIVAAEVLQEGKPIKVNLTEPLYLAWSSSEPEANLECQLEPNASKRLWIADVNYSGLLWIMRDQDRIPLEYQELFGFQGRYRLTIQVDDGKSLSVQTLIEVTSKAADKEKEFSKGTTTISILEQASPLL